MKDTDTHNVIFEIMDTTGDSNLEEMVLCTCKDVDYAVVCYDLSKSDTWIEARIWIQKLRTESNCRIIICGTKRDLLAELYNNRAIHETVINNYADGLQMDYFEVSAKRNEGIGVYKLLS